MHKQVRDEGLTVKLFSQIVSALRERGSVKQNSDFVQAKKWKKSRECSFPAVSEHFVPEFEPFARLSRTQVRDRWRESKADLCFG